MPRTHELLQEDPAARAEFTGQYGMHPNAEALVLAHQSSLDPAIEAASLKPVDAEATKELDLSSVEPELGGKVLDAVVRGNAIVYVAEDADGRTYKGLQPTEGYEAPKTDPGGEAARAASKAAAKMARLSANANANIEAKVAEYRAELQQQAAEALAEASEETQSEAQQAAEEAAEQAEAEAKEAAEATAESKPTRSRSRSTS
jgi:peptidoglycan DL-endopeptidase RipA